MGEGGGGPTLATRCRQDVSIHDASLPDAWHRIAAQLHAEAAADQLPADHSLHFLAALSPLPAPPGHSGCRR